MIAIKCVIKEFHIFPRFEAKRIYMSVTFPISFSKKILNFMPAKNPKALRLRTKHKRYINSAPLIFGKGA